MIILTIRSFYLLKQFPKFSRTSFWEGERHQRLWKNPHTKLTQAGSAVESIIVQTLDSVRYGDLAHGLA